MGLSTSPQTGVRILLSGGIDSAACVEFFKSEEYSVSALHVKYGQPSQDQELAAALAVAEHYKIPISVVEYRGAQAHSHGEILGRNAFLLLAALLEHPGSPALLATGVHAGTPYFDCSPAFCEIIQELLDGYTGGSVKLSNPFMNWTKRDVWDFSLSRGVPIALTRSCEAGATRPCGRCLSCRDREALNAL